MALKPVLFLISFFWLLKPCHGANKKCNETKCKLVIAGNDLPSEFGSKSTEDGVRMVYLNLKVGNNSYNPLQSYDKFQPNKWSWARNIGEPMLSFSYQYQVLSLSLLSNQVRNMEVLLNEEPTGCLANLTSSCKDIVVGRTLLQKIAPKAARGSLHSEDVVCVSVIKRDLDTLGWLGTLYYGNVEYHCCNAEDKRGNATSVQCELPVKESKWLKFFYRALDILTIFAYLFWTDFLILLPDCLFKFENKENGGFSPITEKNVILDEIPVDDLSPITCPTFLNKCVQHFPTTGNLFKLFCVYYIFMLSTTYIYLALHYTLLSEFFTEIEAKHAYMQTVFYYVFDIRSNIYCLIFAIILYLIVPGVYIFVLESRPQHINQLPEKMRKTLKEELPKSIFSSKCPIKYTRLINVSFPGTLAKSILAYPAHRFSTENKCGIIWKSLFYFSYLFAIVFYLSFLLLCGAIYGTVGTIALVYFLIRSAFVIIYLSPSCNLFRILTREVKESFPNGKVKFVPYIIIFFWVNYINLMASLCCRFFTRMFGFIVMGLIINAQQTTSYVIFTYVLINNISTSYNNFQNRFKEVKEMISKHWKGKTGSLPDVKITANTIPINLFWYVCDEPTNVLPLLQESILMLAGMLIISSVLFLAFAAIVFFGEEHNSPLITAAAVLLSGQIPDMLFKRFVRRSKFQGWNKINKEKKIEIAVNKFIEETKNKAVPSTFDSTESLV